MVPTPEEIAAAAAAKAATDEAAAKVAADEKAKNDKEMAPVPYSRFEEVNREKNEALKKLKEREEKEQKETEARLTEQNQFKEIADNRAKELADLKPQAAKVEAYEKTLQAVLDAEIAEIPEGKRSLIPDKLSIQDKLEWLAKNKAILKAPGSFDIGAGKQGADGGNAATLEPGEVETAKQYNMTPEEYAAYKDPKHSKANEPAKK